MRVDAMTEKLTVTCSDFRLILRNTLHDFANLKNWKRDLAIMQQISAGRTVHDQA
jgi:hypothetical protein